MKRWRTNYLQIAALVDAACAVVCDFGIFFLHYPRSPHKIVIIVAAIVFPLLWLCALAISHAYSERIIGSGVDEPRSVLNAGLGVVLFSIVVAYLPNIDISRFYVLAVPAATTVLDLTGRYLMRRRLYRLRSAGKCMQRVIVVGHESAVANLISELNRERHHGLSVVGACVPHASGSTEIAGVPVTGTLDDVLESVIRYGADTVAVLACPEIDGIRLRALAWQLEKTATEICVVPSLLDVAGPRMTIRPVAGLALVYVDHPELSGMALLIKGSFDRIIAALAIILSSPLLIGLAIAIRLSDRGPALFTQIRVGKDGKVFRLYKFRTMVVDAEQRRAQLLAMNDSDGVLFKLRKDPRVTAIGAHLRRWSIDELPELFNVLLGDMSLVGPSRLSQMKRPGTLIMYGAGSQ